MLRERHDNAVRGGEGGRCTHACACVSVAGGVMVRWEWVWECAIGVPDPGLASGARFGGAPGLVGERALGARPRRCWRG